MEEYTVLFFGERYFSYSGSFDNYIYSMVYNLAVKYRQVNLMFFGESRFDTHILILIERLCKEKRITNITKTLILPYNTPEYIYKRELMEKLFDKIEIHYHPLPVDEVLITRNKYAIAKADSIVCFVKDQDEVLNHALNYANITKPTKNLAKYIR